MARDVTEKEWQALVAKVEKDGERKVRAFWDKKQVKAVLSGDYDTLNKARAHINAIDNLRNPSLLCL